MTKGATAGAAPLRVGVTGHRVLIEEDVLRSAVRRAISMLETSYPRRPLVIYSALADGADRLVVEEAIADRGATFVAVLPLPVADYLEDCRDARSRSQFTRLLGQASETIVVPRCDSRIEAYWQAGRHIVDSSDVLMALWDGLPAQGRSGTGEVVAYARAHQRPLVWIHVGNRKQGTDIPTTLGAAQGRLTVERLPQ